MEKEIEDLQRKRCGFTGMLEDAFPEEPKEEVESKPIIRGFGRGFIGQLEESSTSTSKEVSDMEVEQMLREFETRITNAVETALKASTGAKKTAQRSMGFKGMLEDAFGSQPTEDRQPVVKGFSKVRGAGYSEQLEEVFAGSPALDEATEKPKKRIPLGFVAMLEDAFSR